MTLEIIPNVARSVGARRGPPAATIQLSPGFKSEASKGISSFISQGEASLFLRLGG